MPCVTVQQQVQQPHQPATTNYDLAQVVNVDAFQADRGERRNPDPPPEVGVGQRCALGTGERESTAGTARRCLRRSDPIRSAKSTTRRPARDFGGPNAAAKNRLDQCEQLRTERPVLRTLVVGLGALIAARAYD